MESWNAIERCIAEGEKIATGTETLEEEIRRLRRSIRRDRAFLKRAMENPQNFFGVEDLIIIHTHEKRRLQQILKRKDKKQRFKKGD